MGFIRPDDLCSKKPVEQEVGAGLRRRLADQHQNAVKAEFGRCRGSLAAVVGLQSPGGDERIGPGRLGFGHQEFQFAGLVAAKGEAGLVVALDQQVRAMQGFFQPRHGFNGCGQVGKTNTRNIVHGFKFTAKKGRTRRLFWGRFCFWIRILTWKIINDSAYPVTHQIDIPVKQETKVTIL